MSNENQRSTPPAGETQESVDGVQGELMISILLEDCTVYRGTRAQLEAEGVIPHDLVWPQGKDRKAWMAGMCEFELRRCRPEGMKGPEKLWLEGDFWVLQIVPDGFPPFESHIRRKARELRNAIYWQTTEGERRWSATFRSADKADKDAAFQAFKAKIPALREPAKRPRGRRPAASTGSGR